MSLHALQSEERDSASGKAGLAAVVTAFKGGGWATSGVDVTPSPVSMERFPHLIPQRLN